MTDGPAWPEGCGLRLDPATRRVDDGRVLIGGTPLRVLRLSAGGATWLDRVDRGEPVPTGAASSALARRLADGGLAHPVPAPGTGPTRRDVAVVIPVLDDAEGLARTLASIGPVARVVVVDDGSHDGSMIERTVRAARLGGDPTAATAPTVAVTVVRHPRPTGPGNARQRGWQGVTEPVVAFVDADVVVPAGWLDGLLPHLADPTVAAVAPRVRSRPGDAHPTLAAYEAVRSPLDLGTASAPVRPGSAVPYVPTACLVVRRTALAAAGGFDPALRHGEDVDLVWRLHDAGWRLRYEPAIEATHPSRATFAAWVRQRVGYGSSAAALAARHGDAVAPLRGLSGWSGLAWGAVVAGHPVIGAVAAAGSSAALVPKLSGLSRPGPEALRLAGTGHLWAGRAVAEALRRPWWPLALALATVHRRSRPVLLAAAVIAPALDWRRQRPALGPVSYTVLRLIDDAAYGVGVWQGCRRARSWRALLPAFSGPLDVGTPPDRPAPGPGGSTAVSRPR